MAFPPEEIGKRIRTVREELGVAVGDLATACGADVATIEELEAGTLDPIPGDYILIAARMLKTDFRYFISDALDDVEEETRQVFRVAATARRAVQSSSGASAGADGSSRRIIENHSLDSCSMIVVGVDDAGEVTGVSDADALVRELHNFVAAKINPAPLLSASVHEFGDKTFVMIDVPQGADKP